jgi:phosphoribosylaminoimidazole carboxylase PurE protein
MEAKVGIIIGSQSDAELMSEASTVLGQFGISSETRVLSAHRSPHAALKYVESAEQRGLRILIAGAGAAAHLAGFLAAHTILPVIGVPVDSSPLKGLDALLSTVQMPAGVPVACVAIGKAGARNAGFLAAQILALSDPDLAARLREHRARVENEIAG